MVLLLGRVDIYEIEIDYTNHRGERSIRRIIPSHIVFESNQWHKKAQWILYAEDLDKGEQRGFALKDIKEWGNRNIQRKELTKPTICIGEATISELRAGNMVEISTVTLIPASDLRPIPVSGEAL